MRLLEEFPEFQGRKVHSLEVLFGLPNILRIQLAHQLESSEKDLPPRRHLLYLIEECQLPSRIERAIGLAHLDELGVVRGEPRQLLLDYLALESLGIRKEGAHAENASTGAEHVSQIGRCPCKDLLRQTARHRWRRPSLAEGDHTLRLPLHAVLHLPDCHPLPRNLCLRQLEGLQSLKILGHLQPRQCNAPEIGRLGHFLSQRSYQLRIRSLSHLRIEHDRS
mmetsp:Transcript_25554/g.56339  ORF Transcript_25554/g.56339 Transcript_25554/m.56339 type:complete len:222 (+) Transcript_25554:162-827(+)